MLGKQVTYTAPGMSLMGVRMLSQSILAIHGYGIVFV